MRVYTHEPTTVVYQPACGMVPLTASARMAYLGAALGRSLAPLHAERAARTGQGARSDVRAWVAAGLAQDDDTDTTTTPGDPT